MKQLQAILCGVLLLGLAGCEANSTDSPSSTPSENPSTEVPVTSSPETAPGFTAESYHEKLVRLQSDVLTDLLILSDVLDSSDPNTIWQAHITYLETAHRVVAEAEQLPPFEGNTELRDAAIALFLFYAESGETEYRRMVELMLQPTLAEEDVKEWEEINQRLTEQEMPLDIQFAQVQSDFAEKYGLQLMQNTMEEQFVPLEGSGQP